MANVQCPGFIPLKNRTAGASISHKRVRVLTNNTTAIGFGDAVIKNADGAYTVASSGTAIIASVAQGASYVSSGQRIERPSLPAATLYTSSGVDPENASFIYIVDDQVNTVFEASIDEAITMAELGLNFDFVLGTLSATTGLSGHELDATAPAVTAPTPWRVNDFIRGRAGHDPDAADCHVECQVNDGQDAAALNTTGT